MGTNYYLEGRPPCPHCGRHYPARHIGKSSGGWCFSLRVYPEEGINDLADWLPLFEKGTIYDEYNEVVSAADMKKTITRRAHRPPKDKPFMYDSWDQFYNMNQAEPGPNNLARSMIDGRRCIGHGAGTWDLMIGEFS